MGQRPPVSLIIPNRNNERALELVFRHLHRHTSYPDFELVVIDDGSTDGSRSVIRRWRDGRQFNNFQYIELDHGGVVQALNTGLEAAAGDLVVQLDADATVETPGWLERMVDFYSSDPRIGIVNPLVLYEGGEVHAAGVNMLCEEGLHDRTSEPTEPAGRRKVHTLVTRRMPEEAGELVTRVAEVDVTIGVCMLYSRELARELGGYDMGFSPVWFDDLDLSLRIRESGLKAFYLPGVDVTHRMSLRHAREPARTGLTKVRKRIRSTVASLFPDSVRLAANRIENRNTPHSPEHLRRIRRHYDYWEQKWGFSLINPDLEAIRRRYEDTQLWWRYDPALRADGERIAAAWEAQLSAAVTSP
jgi:GT2 family glycosyltransferase